MKLNFVLDLDFEEENNLYYKLLKNEDFDFKTKDIAIIIAQNSKDNKIKVEFEVNSVIDLKIASTAVIKSLEIINKTLKI